MDTLGKADRRYLDELTVHLQLDRVPGDRIGEILAEAEAHAAATGEPLREAFGDPKEYAAQWAAPRPRRWWARAVVFGILGGLFSGLLTVGAHALAAGPENLPFDLPLPPWALLVVGTLGVVGIAAVLPINVIRDPRTGARTGWGRPALVLLGLGLSVLIIAAGALVGLLR
jgi:hypothetical protein